MAECPSGVHPARICRYVFNEPDSNSGADGIADALEWPAALRFGFSFMAIVPLAKVSSKGSSNRNGTATDGYQLLGDATEQLSMKLGQTLGGLLNATSVLKLACNTLGFESY